MSRSKKSHAKDNRPAAGGSGPAGPETPSPLRNRPAWHVFLGLMLLASLAYTWPLAVSPGSSLLGRFSNYYGDTFGAIWELWATKYLLFNLHTNPLIVKMLAGPYASFWFSFAAYHKYLLVMSPLTAALGPIGAFNAYLFLDYVLAGLAMYFLALELTGNRTAAAVAGLLYAFNPYHYAHGIVHMDLAATWPMPLVILALLRLERRRSWTNFSFLALALVLFHVYCSLYYYIFLPLVCAAWLIVRGVDTYAFDIGRWRRVRGALAAVPRGRKIAVAVSALVLATAAAVIYSRYVMPAASQLARPIEWQERFKLSWANYLVPGVDHPIFGGITKYFVPIRRNVPESTAYLGWVALLLGLGGFWSARRDRRAWLLLAFGLASLSLTLGPYLRLGGLTIPLPSILLHELAPFVRVISRYSIFVEMSLTALTAYGVVALLRRLPAGRHVAALAVVILLAALEFARPAGVTAVVSSPDQAPPVYAALAGLDKNAIVFEYPPVASSGLPFSDYQYYQSLHQRTLFNRVYDTTTIPTEYLPFWQDMDYPGALSDPNNVRLLRYFQVDYLAIHDRERQNPPSLSLPDPARVEGLELVQDYGADRLYRVVAEPATVMLSFQTIPYYNYLETRREATNEGFMAPQVIGSGADRLGWRIMKDRGGLTVRSLSGKSQRVRITARALSFEKPRTLRVNGPEGPLAGIEIGTAPQDVSLATLELAPGQVLELDLDTPEGSSELTTAAGKLRASVALAALRVETLE